METVSNPHVLRRATPIATLQRNAAHNNCLKAVLQQFANRQRTRASLTVTGLALAMKKEGLEFSKAQYQVVLQLLGETGFGTLKYGRQNKPIALTNIKVTLQSIGKAVLTGETKIDPFRPANKFEEVHTPIAQSFVEKEPKFGMSLVLQLPGGAMTVNCKNKVSMEEFGKFLADFYELTGKYESECV